MSLPARRTTLTSNEHIGQMNHKGCSSANAAGASCVPGRRVRDRPGLGEIDGTRFSAGALSARRALPVPQKARRTGLPVLTSTYTCRL